MINRRQWCGAGLAWGLLPGATQAQSDWRQVAVPMYGPPDFVAGFVHGHALPRARAWQAACAGLEAVLALALAWASAATPTAAAVGWGAPPRAAWRETALAWSALAAVATGPLVTRRSARRVDFQPVRVPLVLRALAQGSVGEVDMAGVGTAAKGLAALEWLLWAPEAPHGAQAGAYALALAHDLRHEADAVVAEFTAQAAQPADDEAVVAAFAEVLNQWTGALEHLRLQRLLRPVEEARTRGQRHPLALRPWARVDAEERAARWQAVQSLALFGGGAAPARASGLPVPLETYLRGRGLNALADQLRRLIQAAGLALNQAADNRPATMRRAAQALGTVKHWAEADLAPALQVQVGFSDADGD